jgi:hypothetical protein
MARYVASVTTPLPPAEAFDYLADFSSVAEWDPGVVRATALDPEPRRLGARFEVVARFLGREVPLEYRTVEIEAPDRVVLRAQTATVVSLDTISFRPMPAGGTEVTYDADLRLRGPLRLADPLLALAFRRVGDRARDGLEQALRR